MAVELPVPAEVTVTAYVGRTHLPCGACDALVWIVEGCPHIKSVRERTQRDHTRATRRANERARAMVSRTELINAIGYPRP
jgi:hypothetical protein